tara:strand:+ start:107 stop:766 length:660 start_codon:yes stop_codon:yes gene_type:complete
MNKIIEVPILILLLFTLLPVSSALGKIGDPRPLINGNIRYESHRHTVWVTDIRTKKVLWKTTIPMARFRGDVDPRLERDVQWNIIISLKLEGQTLVVTNSKGEKFKLDSRTGKLAKPPSEKIDLPEALRRSTIEHRGEKHYKIHIDSDGMTWISGRIVSNEELKTLYRYSDNREMKIYLFVYGNQDADSVFDSLNSVQHWRQISYHSTKQESGIMQKRR